MVVSLIMGMGVPTTAAYLVLASLVAPTMIQLGIPPLAAHMFIFYFGCISSITPPVALAAYAGAGLAGCDPNKTGYKAFRLAFCSFLMPYLFVYNPVLLMEGGVLDILWSLVTALIGAYLLASGFEAKCYDGKAFFATDHEVGKNAVSNKITSKLSLESYVTARAMMRGYKNSKGRSLALVPNLLVVPPTLEAKAREILVAEFINGTKNTMQGTAELHVEPRLTSDTAWFLLDTSRPIKPLIYQQRKKAKFVSKTAETDDNVFMSKKFIYGADSRGNAGFGFWQMAVGSDGSEV